MKVEGLVCGDCRHGDHSQHTDTGGLCAGTRVFGGAGNCQCDWIPAETIQIMGEMYGQDERE